MLFPDKPTQCSKETASQDLVTMIPLLDVNWQGLPTPYSPSYRDTEVLSFIEEEDLTTFTFDGLKRRLGLHPETLSRILNRLEQEGIVIKNSDGYTVTPKITKLKLQTQRTEEPSTPLLQTFLPSDIRIQQLVAQIKGKWFANLRWLGISENNEGIGLKWITEDGSIQLNANMVGTELNIEAKFLTCNDLDLALKAAYQLMSFISRKCTGTRLARHVAYYGTANTYPYSDFTVA
jgi:hypothetical protein